MLLRFLHFLLKKMDDSLVARALVTFDSMLEVLVLDKYGFCG
jgi:hypothetical protein